MSALINRIAGTGLFALDVLVRLDGSVANPSLGGSAGNVLSILGALGWTAVPIGTTGDDSAATLLNDAFDALGADLSFFKRSKHQCTPIIYQHQQGADAEDTHRFSFTCPVCGERRRPVWGDEQAILKAQERLPAASVFFLDRPTKLGVALAQRYASQGTLVIFEPSSLGDDPDLFRSALHAAHIVKYADERLDDLPYEKAARPLVEIQTRGADGLRFRVRSLDNAWLTLGAYALPYVRDTSGAGDWCTAGLIFELFRLGGLPKMADHSALVRALVFGQALSSLNCLTEGARGLLAAWSPQKILKAAGELRGRRLQSLMTDKLHPEQRVNEPRLALLAGDKNLGKLKDVAHDEAVCCVEH